MLDAIEPLADRSRSSTPAAPHGPGPGRDRSRRLRARPTSSSASTSTAPRCARRPASRGSGWFNNHAAGLKSLRNRLLSRTSSPAIPRSSTSRSRAPIIIVGLPRTGTTHLHNLMSADPALRSLPYWESLEPVLAAAEQPAPGEPDPRIASAARRGSTSCTRRCRYFDRMHEMTVDHVHEEIQLLTIDFSTMLIETSVTCRRGPRTTWRTTRRRRTAYMKKVLQCCQCLRGGDRWVLKSPQHLEQFPVLVDVFPDATFVVTHRDPVSVTASMATMVAYGVAHEPGPPGSRRRSGATGPRASRRCCAACVRDRDVLPADRPSTCGSTSSWPTTWRWSSGSTTLAGQPMTDAAPSGDGRSSWPTTPAAGTAPSSTTSPIRPRPRRAPRSALRFYSDRFGVTLESLTCVFQRSIDALRNAPQSLTTSVVGRVGVASGRNQRNQMRPRRVARGRHPVRAAGVAVRDHDRPRAVGLVRHLRAVDRDLLVVVVVRVQERVPQAQFQNAHSGERPWITSASSSARSKLPIAYAASPAAHPNVVVGTGYGSSMWFGSPSDERHHLRLLAQPRGRGTEPAREVGVVLAVRGRRVERLDVPLRPATVRRVVEVVARDGAHRVVLELDERAVPLVGPARPPA